MRDCPLCQGRWDAQANLGASEGATAVRIPPTGMPLVEIERQAVVQALKMSNWVQKDAAALLRISPRVINYKIKILAIELPERRRVIVEPARLMPVYVPAVAAPTKATRTSRSF